MKRLLLALSAFALSLTAHSQPAPVNPRPATQAQVNAGTDKFDFVTPATLAGWSGGGGSFGTMANQNANAVAITGGTTSGLTGTGNTESGLSLVGITNIGGSLAYAPYRPGTLNVDVTQPYSLITLTDADAGNPNETLAFVNTPGVAGQTWSVDIYNSSSTVVHGPIVPSSFDYNAGAQETTFYIQPLSYVRLTWITPDGTNYHMSGAPRTVNDLATKATPIAADLVGIYDSASTGVMKKATLSSLPYQHSITFVVNGASGGAITAGTSGYVPAGYPGTITKWKIMGAPASSSVTCDFFRLAYASSSGGTVLPTANSLVGSGTKPALSSAVMAYGTPSDWVGGGGSVTIAENDELALSVTSPTTITYLTVTLYLQ